MSAPRRGSAPGVGVLVALLLLVAACGLPGDGAVSRVDDDSVPYGLLDADGSSSADTDGPAAQGPGPVIFWLSPGDRLLPSATDTTCDQPVEVVVESLLGELAAGPTSEAREEGRSTAIPPESALLLADLADGRVEVDLQSETSISAERLPAAVGQIVLTMTSVAGVDSVTLVSDGGTVPVPLPGGALTDEPVTGEDYAVLVPDRYLERPDVGCPDG